jgi:hypothetical protein
MLPGAKSFIFFHGIFDNTVIASFPNFWLKYINLYLFSGYFDFLADLGFGDRSTNLPQPVGKDARQVPASACAQKTKTG